MTTESLLEQAVGLIGDRAIAQSTPEPGRVDLTVEAPQLLDAIRQLLSARWGYLAAITGLAQGPEAGRIEVLYHFCREAAVATLRVPLPREAPVVPSIYGLIPSASLFERELMEMFGVVCDGTPDPRRLFLPDDWPGGTYPLRKDFIVPASGTEAEK
jgi:Ni,Fe-hydrogenase III component G